MDVNDFVETVSLSKVVINLLRQNLILFNKEQFVKKVIIGIKVLVQDVFQMDFAKICPDGYALNQQGKCISCSQITDCQTCYYGDSSGRNFSQDPTYFVNNQSLNNADIKLRCTFCAKTEPLQAGGNPITSVLIDKMMIPSLDLLQCKNCPDDCIRCDYSTINGGQEIHTKNPRIITKNPEEYTMRCRVCKKTKVLNPQGKCEDQDPLISNCKKFTYGTPSSSNNKDLYYTLNIYDFKIQDSQILSSNSPHQQYCAICDVGFNRNSLGKCVQIVDFNDPPTNPPDPNPRKKNCQSEILGQCAICNDNRVADKDICNTYQGDMQNCGQYYKAYKSQSDSYTYCLSCVQYEGGKSNGYPDYSTNQCTQCDNYGVCGECTQWNWRFNVIDYLQFERPYLDNKNFQVFQDELQLENTAWCLQCDAPNIQDAWTGLCYGCIQGCGDCSRKFGKPQCYSCLPSTNTLQNGLTIKKSQNLSKLGCHECSDYEKNCVELNNEEKKFRNPYHVNSKQFYNKVRWTKANQCRVISGDIDSSTVHPLSPLYNGRYMFFNSLNQKCIVCKTSAGCKKKVQVPYYIDIEENQHIDIATYLSPQTPTFTGYNAYSLKYFSSQGVDININMREALQFSNLYIKFSEEGVEEIEFKVLFVGNVGIGNYLNSAKIDFKLNFVSQALEMIPTLQQVKVTIDTMIKGQTNSVGTKKMKIYLKDQINFSQIPYVSFNNIEIYPIENIDSNAGKNPFYIQLTNVLLTTTVEFNNCKIGNVNQINDQKNDFTEKGSSQYFTLISPNLVSLTLKNFVLDQIYYPPQINFFNPGPSDQKLSVSLNTVTFSGLQFSYVNVFGLNNTQSQIYMDVVTISGTEFDNAYFIKEKDGLKSSYIRLDMSNIVFKDLVLSDSYLVYVMNAVRFKSSDWTFQGKFLAQSVDQPTSLICTNLLSIQRVTVQNDPNDQNKLFELKESTLFSTPSYSTLVQQNLQINHRYTDVSITSVKCDLTADSTSTTGVYTCFFDLKSPYNPRGYLLNVMMGNVMIKNTQTTQNKVQSQWKLMNMQQIDSLSLGTIKLYNNKIFQGIYVYNPDSFEVSDFICGDENDSSYKDMIILSGTTNANDIDQKKLQGYCINAVYCQKSLSFESIVLQNYSGLNQSPFMIQCTKDIKNEQDNSQIPVNISSFKVDNSIIFLNNENVQASPFFIQNPYSFNIIIDDINVKKSQIKHIESKTTSSYPSSTVLLVDSISSNLVITDSLVQDTISLYTSNAIVAIIFKLTVQNCHFQNANIGVNNQNINTEGGFIYARGSRLTFQDLILETSVANKGSGLYLKTIGDSQINISGASKFYDLQTSSNTKTQGYGAGIYVDCTESSMVFNIDGAWFESMFARTIGGVLYVKSAANQLDITIKNSVIRNVYAPQGSLIYANLINGQSTITLQDNIIEWTEQKRIYEYITNTLGASGSPDDPILQFALVEHSQIWISKGSLKTQNNIFTSIQFQKLMMLNQLKKWEDDSSKVDGYQMTTYPLIQTYKIETISLKNTIISNTYPFKEIIETKIFSSFTNEKVSIVYHQNDGQITYTGVQIKNNRDKSSKHGIVYFNQWTSVLTIDSCVVNQNIGTKGALYLSQVSSTSSSSRILAPVVTYAVITQSTFDGNEADYGAALNSFSTILEISSSTFTNNYAKESGGAIYSYQPSDSDTLPTISFKGLTFSNNIAGSGGAYQINGISPQLDTVQQNTFSDNLATYFGNTNVESPVSIRLVYNGKIYNYKQSSSTIPTISFYGSGLSPGSLIAQLIGSDGKVMRSQTATCKLSLNYESSESYDTSIKITGTTTIKFDEKIGGYNFTHMILIAKPPNELKLKFQSDAVIIPVKDSTGAITRYDKSYVFPLIINMRACIKGEIYEATNGQCYACPQYKYSIQIGAEVCLSCPKSGVDECPGYDILKLSAGYWRKNTSSDLIEPCSNLKENCVGGNGNQLCYEGHIGALCEECDLYGEVWGEAWAPSGNYECGKCSSVSGNVQKVVLISIWTLITTLLSVKSTIKQVQEYIVGQILIQAGFMLGGKSSNSKDQAGVILKILTSYFQVIAVLFTFKLTFPSFFQSTTDAIGNPSAQMSVSMDCFFLQMSDIPVPYFRLIWQLINPLFFVVASVLAYIIGVITKKIRKNIGYIWCTFIFLFITLQPSVISAFIATASCRKIAGVNYIKANVSYECYTTQHSSYLGALIVPSLLAWTFIIPLLFFIKLYRSRDKIYSNIWIRYRYGYLYMEYHRRAYFWEFIKMFEKIALLIIVNVYDNDTKVKGVLCFLTVVIYLIFSYIFRPYLQNEQNRLDQRANEACALSMIMGVFIYGNSYSYLITVGYIILGFINILFVLDIFRVLVRGYTKTLDEVINKQHEKIVKLLAKYPSIQKFVIKKHQAFVPYERVAFLWRKTSKIIHKWFRDKKLDPSLKLFEDAPKASRKSIEQEEVEILDEKELIQPKGKGKAFAQRKSKFGDIRVKAESELTQLPLNNSPQIPDSPQIDENNEGGGVLLNKIQINSKFNQNQDFVDDFNLDSESTPQNKVINLGGGGDTPQRRIKQNKEDSIKSYRSKIEDDNHHFIQ